MSTATADDIDAAAQRVARIIDGEDTVATSTRIADGCRAYGPTRDMAELAVADLVTLANAYLSLNEVCDPIGDIRAAIVVGSKQRGVSDKQLTDTIVDALPDWLRQSLFVQRGQ